MKTKPKIAIDIKKVESLAERGLSQAQIADALGISARTLYERKAESAEFAEAIKRGRAKGIAFVSNKLMEQVSGGNVTAMIFFLKAQANWHEMNRTEVTGPAGGPVQMVALDFDAVMKKRNGAAP
jgi:DNA-binding XRE family transcriptional regulator